MELTIRIGLLIAGLFALWLLMSGIYKPHIIAFGLLSSALCIWITQRLGLLAGKPAYEDLFIFKSARYIFWLLVEIGKADWAVTKVIISRTPEVRQRLISVPVSQRSDLAKTLFANSITLTPGTVTVETETDQMIVHALTDEAADLENLNEMGMRISQLEKPEIEEQV